MALVALATSCSKHTVIPDRELQDIIKEMFIVNAYIADQRVDADSMEVYAPILHRYGYTEDDLFVTLANFQKRKSARLSHVLEGAIASLEGLSAGYEQKLRDLKYIDSLAKAQCKREVMFIENITVKRMSDTAKLNISIPIVGPGEHLLSYVYTIDTLDHNERLQSTHSQWDSLDNRLYYMRHTLTKGKRSPYNTRFLGRPTAVEYRLQLADYAKREDSPHITIDSLRVTYLPPTEEALRHMDSLMQFRPDIILSDSIDFFNPVEAVLPLLPTDTLKAMEERAAKEAETLKKNKKTKK